MAEAEIKQVQFNADFSFEQPIEDLVLVIKVITPSGKEIIHRTTFQGRSKLPSLDDAWKKFTPILQKYIDGTKELTYDTEDLQTKLSKSINDIDVEKFKEKREESKRVRERLAKENKEAKEKAKARAEQQDGSVVMCPDCSIPLDQVTLGNKSGWKCSKCGYEQVEQPVQLPNYVVTDKDGNKFRISNFLVIFNRLLKIDNDAKLYDCTFSYVKEGSGKKDRIKNIEVAETTFHISKDFTKFFAKYSEKLWRDRRHTDDLLTSINQDENIQYENGTIEIVHKTQNFGWNSDFTKYCTPEWDYELKKDSDGVFAYDRQYNTFELVSHKDYIEKHGIDIDDPETPKPEGSVKILNPTISGIIKLGFKNDAHNTYENLMHVKNNLLNLSPVMHRIIPIVFISPLSSMLEKMGKKYQQYLKGTSGFGKTQTATLLMNFFADIDDDKLLVNILRDKLNAIEEIGYYHKDCLFVIDNFKESAIDKKDYPRIKAFLQSIADRQGTRRMTESSFGSYNIRGTTLVTGEEILQDASTIRKYDVITFKEKFNEEIHKECIAYRKNYSSVTAAYIRWLLETYGDEINDNIKSRIEKYSNFKEIIFTLNAVGYELFLDFMLHHKVLTEAEHNEWLKVHIEKLKEDDAAKQIEVKGKSNAQLFKDVVTAMITGREGELKGDFEYNKTGRHEIGQVTKSGEIIFWEKMYPLVKGYAYRNGVTLPDDFDSVIEKLREEVGVAKWCSARVTGEKNPTKLPSFLRSDILPYSSMDEFVNMDDIAGILLEVIEDSLRITISPNAEQYNSIFNYLLERYVPDSKYKNNTAKDMFVRDVAPLVKTYFRIKYGRNWTVPLK